MGIVTFFSIELIKTLREASFKHFGEVSEWVVGLFLIEIVPVGKHIKKTRLIAV
jgi:hypothetical protein